ncbi:unnamed protein product [Orchesella dallaii]|uniref:DNA/RNA non-specific endonuclease/pyrophosphatase/phosphodiesterase domain-containing protein n=1 Tax=Orchesella dallaii TaxID=48710 RepID=A0ABP1Q791_9HEXA
MKWGDSSLPQWYPLVFDSSGIIYPRRTANNSDWSIVIPQNSDFTLSCTTSNKFQHHKKISELKVHCHRSGHQVNKKSVQFNQLGCNKPVKEKVVTAGKCYNQSTSVDILFQSKSKRLPLINICHNADLDDTIFAHHFIRGSALNPFEVSNKRPTFKEGKFYTKISANDAYKKTAQLQHIESLALEFALRTYAKNKNTDLEVWTGGKDILKLDDVNGNPVEIFLSSHSKSSPSLPVPEILWKVVKDPERNASVAVFVINNPHLTDVPSIMLHCPCVCSQISWVTWDVKKVEKGYTYCCEMNTVSKILPYLPDMTDIVGGTTVGRINVNPTTTTRRNLGTYVGIGTRKSCHFNDPFIPIRLKYYSPFTNTPAPYGVHAMCLPNRCCPTQVIAYDNGHLFECIPRGPSSPWGDYSTSIMEQTATCLCIDKLRHPEKWAAPKHIFIANEENNHEKEAENIAKFLNENPEEYKNMVEKNIQDCYCPPTCPCPPNPGCCGGGFPMKVVICNSEAEKKRVVREMKRQQREWRRCAAGIRGRMKGRTGFSPAEVRFGTWDGCRGGGNALGKTYGCKKSC